MNNDRDPALQALFTETKEELTGKAFTAQTMGEIDKLRRRAVIGWTCIGLALLVLAALLAAALQDAVLLLTQGLNLSLVNLENRWLAQILSPVNSVAGVVALGFVGLHRIYRRVFA